MTASSPRILRTFEEFAVADVYTGDIDPVYFGIARARMHIDGPWATRFAVGMLTYYHTGIAAKAADQGSMDFWSYIEDQYDTAPRAAERRHWRGDQGRRSLASMKSFSPEPEDFFHKLHAPNYRSVQKNCADNLVGFGSYFVLKICDYMDRCLGMPITSYAGLAENLPTLPAKAAELLTPGISIPAAFMSACNRVYALGLSAPPLFDRPIGPAEVETILCDWKRAKYGNHKVGDDVMDKRQSLVGCGENAEKMREFLPQEISLDTFKCELL